jgi:hypothetical protein
MRPILAFRENGPMPFRRSADAACSLAGAPFA